MRESSITGNFGDDFGGGLATYGNTDMVNSTVAHNRTNYEGGGIAVGSFPDIEGGCLGCQFLRGTLHVLNSTIVDNHAISEDGGGISVGPFSAAVTLENTILALNTIGPSGQGPECWGAVTSLGNNLIGDPSGCGVALLGSDLTGDPGLGDFSDDGTPGNGHFPLLPTSQAIGAGNDAACRKKTSSESLGWVRATSGLFAQAAGFRRDH